MQVPQDVVEQAVGRVVEVGEQQQGRGGRQHHRQVDQATQVSLGVPQLVEQDGHEERHGVADDQGQDGELQRVLPGRPEGRVVEDALIVRPARPAGHAQPGLLEAHHDLAAHRVPGEEGETEHGADQEPVRGRVAPDPGGEPVPGAGSRRGQGRWLTQRGEVSHCWPGSG